MKTLNSGASADEAMLSRSALADRWLTTPGRLANMAYNGVGPAMVKIGQRVLYPMVDVLAYEAANRVEPVSA